MYIILVSAGKQPSQQFSKLAKLSELESQQDDEEHLDLDLQGGESTSTNKESTAGSVPPSSSSSKQNHIGPSSFDESKDDIGATGKLNGYPLGVWDSSEQYAVDFLYFEKSISYYIKPFFKHTFKEEAILMHDEICFKFLSYLS